MAKNIVLKLGGFVLRASLGRVPPPNNTGFFRKLELGYGRALEDRYPALRSFGFVLTEENAGAVVGFYTSYLPLIREESRSAALRSMLQSLIDGTSDVEVKQAAARAMAQSNLEDGLAERATILADLPQWQAEAARLETAYGAPLITQSWRDADRGLTLRHYFSAHTEMLRGKDILHFAPEGGLESWLRAEQAAIGIKSYITTDGQHAANEHHDITGTSLAGASFDLVICHRVMEHVLDDTAGFAELYRILRPGGLLSFSVPQAPQRPATAEWAIPDTSHDGHVRQYGADLTDRMKAAGFDVTPEPWLLNRPHDELRANHAYPMRLYHAQKPG